MIYTFEYEETLSRRVRIQGDNLAEALTELYRRLEHEELVLSGDDFCGAKVTMPLEENPFLKLMEEGEEVKDLCHDLEIDWW